MRAHAPLFQDMADLDMMVCDEGHRLKNTEETQTMKALRSHHRIYHLYLILNTTIPAPSIARAPLAVDYC